VGTAGQTFVQNAIIGAAFAHPTAPVRGSRHKSNKLKSFTESVQARLGVGLENALA